MKLIFLDIDGVLNHQNFYKQRYESKQNKEWELDYPLSEFCPDAIKWLNKLTDETGAKIVLSSTWRMGRTIEEIKELFNSVGITGELVGKTPILNYARYNNESVGSVERGKEIEYWLEKETGFRHINWSKEEQQSYIDKSGVESYIILDDDSDMLYGQRNFFVHILPAPRHLSGFDEHYYNIALEKLNKTIIELNYDSI